jgi:hypothetical protein
MRTQAAHLAAGEYTGQLKPAIVLHQNSLFRILVGAV